jgi:type IV pilus assembly protein PilW
MKSNHNPSMPLHAGRRPTGSGHAGFSLVEILVGLVIGLLATLVILQVFSVYEGQKRTTTGTADAQTNGAIALFSMVRDLKIAGYGLLPTGNSAIKCTTPSISAAAQNDVIVGSTLYSHGVTSLSPVTITDGGGGLSDTITVRYGDNAAAGTSVPITSAAGVNPVTVNNNLGCQPSPGIALLITGPNTCNVTTVTALGGTTTVTLGDATGAAATVNLSCLGKWNEITYQVNAGDLERDVYAGPGVAVSTPTVADIVNIQAQYGISATANSNKIIRWVNAKDTANWNTSFDGQKVQDSNGNDIDWGAGLTTANRNLIKAVRLAVIARNGLLEKSVVTDNYSSGGTSWACDPSTLNSTTPKGVCAWVPISSTSPAPAVDLSNYANWQQYRYRVFETIIPLRNVIWSRSVLP